MKHAQLDDKNIGVIIHWLEHSYEPTTRELQLCGRETRALWLTREHLHLKDGVLFYVWADRDDRSQCLFVPTEHRLRVLYYCHDKNRDTDTLVKQKRLTG